MNNYLGEVVVDEGDEVVGVGDVLDKLPGGGLRLVQLAPLLCPQTESLDGSRRGHIAFSTVLLYTVKGAAAMGKQSKTELKHSQIPQIYTVLPQVTN